MTKIIILKFKTESGKKIIFRATKQKIKIINKLDLKHKLKKY